MLVNIDAGAGIMIIGISFFTFYLFKEFIQKNPQRNCSLMQSRKQRVNPMISPLKARGTAGQRYHHYQVYTQHGAAHPTTDLTIYLSAGVKITASNFDKSNEEMYFKLCDWLERYNQTLDR